MSSLIYYFSCLCKTKKKHLYFIILFVLMSCEKKEDKTKLTQHIPNTKIDSARYWFLKTTALNLTPEQKIIYLNKATTYSNNTDSLYPIILKSKCANYSKLKNYNKAISEANTLKQYAYQKKDTALLSKTYFYLGYYYDKKTRLDSAFTNYTMAYKLSFKIHDSITSTNLLTNIAALQNKLGDFVGAQKNAIKGIQLLNKKKHSKKLYKLYNTLANSFQSNLQFTEAKIAYNDALKHSASYIDTIMCQNNIALNYKKQKNYKEAIRLYQGIIQEKKLDQYPTTKARVYDNLGYTQFLENNNNGLDVILQGKNLRQQHKDNFGLYASHIHLTEYYLNKNKNKALSHAKKALSISEKIKSPDAKTEALKHLIALKEKARQEILEYLSLKDSINFAEKTIKNKYAAVRFLSEKKENENLQLKANNAQQALLTQKANTRNWLLAFGMLALGISAFFIWRRYRTENKAKQIISKQKNTIEALQKELHHRVKNNLAIINAFISSTIDDSNDPKIIEKLAELQNRISSINEVHMQLYNSSDVVHVNLKAYVNSLVQNVATTQNKPNIKVQQHINPEVKLPADTSFPIGLIINEFLTNSYKYAFTDSGEITIVIQDDTNALNISLSDNGKGLPENLNLDNLTTYGLRIMKLLSKQLKASFNLQNNNGVHLQIHIPKT